MDRLGNIMPRAVGYIPKQQPEPAYDEKAIDKVKAWHQVFEGVYNVRALPPAGVIAWVSALQDCNQAVMDTVIREWVREHSAAPKPADLLKEYRYILGEQEQRKKMQADREMRFDAEGNKLYACPFCRDGGYFMQYYGWDAKDTYHVRAYPCSCNRYSGNLSKALADERWEFDFTAWGFVRRRGWVGEKEAGYV